MVTWLETRTKSATKRPDLVLGVGGSRLQQVAQYSFAIFFLEDSRGPNFRSVLGFVGSLWFSDVLLLHHLRGGCWQWWATSRALGWGPWWGTRAKRKAPSCWVCRVFMIMYTSFSWVCLIMVIWTICPEKPVICVKLWCFISVRPRCKVVVSPCWCAWPPWATPVSPALWR